MLPIRKETMIAELQEIRRAARGYLKRAIDAASTIHFSFNERVQRYSRKSMLLASEPKYAELEPFYGFSAWAVILSVDLRGSSNRAVKVGAKNTYIAMHTYLPTMVKLVGEAKGKVVGLRGDGLFAAFGITELKGTGNEVSSSRAAKAVKAAIRCGKSMLEAIDMILNPLLIEEDIPAGLAIGVGVDAGHIVATNIGLSDATEITTYGPPVNHACKFCCGNMAVGVSKTAKNLYPSSPDGKLSFARDPRRQGMWIVKFPNTMQMLA